MSTAEAGEQRDHGRHENPLRCSETDEGKNNGVGLKQSFDSWLQMRTELRNGPKLEPDWWSQLVQRKINVTRCESCCEASGINRHDCLYLFADILISPQSASTQKMNLNTADARSVQTGRNWTEMEQALAAFHAENNTLPRFKYTKHTHTLLYLYPCLHSNPITTHHLWG